MPGFKPGTLAIRANTLPLSYSTDISPNTCYSLVGTIKSAKSAEFTDDNTLHVETLLLHASLRFMNHIELRVIYEIFDPN